MKEYKCYKCNSLDTVKNGFKKTLNGEKIQKYFCNSCKSTLTENFDAEYKSKQIAFIKQAKKQKMKCPEIAKVLGISERTLTRRIKELKNEEEQKKEIVKIETVISSEDAYQKRMKRMFDDED